MRSGNGWLNLGSVAVSFCRLRWPDLKSYFLLLLLLILFFLLFLLLFFSSPSPFLFLFLLLLFHFLLFSSLFFFSSSFLLPLFLLFFFLSFIHSYSNTKQGRGNLHASWVDPMSYNIQPLKTNESIHESVNEIVTKE